MMKVHCDICDRSEEWSFQAISGWRSFRNAMSMSPTAEKHLCDRCWGFLEDHHAELMSE